VYKIEALLQYLSSFEWGLNGIIKYTMCYDVDSYNYTQIYIYTVLAMPQ